MKSKNNAQQEMVAVIYRYFISNNIKVVSRKVN